jgi:hypothetical protein
VGSGWCMKTYKPFGFQWISLLSVALLCILYAIHETNILQGLRVPRPALIPQLQNHVVDLDQIDMGVVLCKSCETHSYITVRCAKTEKENLTLYG